MNSLESQENPLEKLEGTDFSKYRVGSKIGQGGYATVFRATDPELARDVALKILLPKQGGGYPEVLRSRFVREAKLVARLRDVRSIKVLEYGEFNGLLFIAFEFIDGESLDVWMEHSEQMPPLRVVKILEQSLESLADAHDLGIVHRDIKPGNIMLYEIAGRRDQVKVLDFGIGKFTEVNKATVNLTREGSWMGTPRYMAPEQVKGGELSGQSDLYSLGLVAYELLTGLKAIKATEPMEAIAEIASEIDLKLPTDLKVPKGLGDIVNKMIRKEPGRRYQNAAEVLRDLQVLSRQTNDISGLHLAIKSPISPKVAQQVKDKSSKKSLPAIVFVIFLVACVAVSVVWFTDSQTALVEPPPKTVLEILAAEAAAPVEVVKKPVSEVSAVESAAPVETVKKPVSEVSAVESAAPVETVKKPVSEVSAVESAAPVEVVKKPVSEVSAVKAAAPFKTVKKPVSEVSAIEATAPVELVKNPVPEVPAVEAVAPVKLNDRWGIR